MTQTVVEGKVESRKNEQHGPVLPQTCQKHTYKYQWRVVRKSSDPQLQNVSNAARHQQLPLPLMSTISKFTWHSGFFFARPLCCLFDWTVVTFLFFRDLQRSTSSAI
jgi:hypothetical protein